METDLRYEICLVHKAKKTYYFIWDNENEIPETKGSDLETTIYLLFFKVLHFDDKNFLNYSKTIKKQVFEEKSIADNQVFLDNELKPKNILKHTKKFNPDELKINNRSKCLAYLSSFNPQKEYKSHFQSEDSLALEMKRLLERDEVFDSMMGKIMEMILVSMTEKKANLDINDFFSREDLEVMIQGENGDLWSSFYTQINLPGIDKFEILYSAQGLEILKSNQHIQNPAYLSLAINNLRNNQDGLEKVYNAIPDSVKSNMDIMNQFKWNWIGQFHLN